MKPQAKSHRRTPKGASPVSNGIPFASTDEVRKSERLSLSADSGASQQMEGFHFLFDNYAVPAWICNPKTLAFLAVNEAAQRKYGYSRNEFLAMTLKDILPPEEKSRLQANKKHKRLTLQHSGSWHHILRDRTVIETEIISYLLEYEGHQVLLMVAQNMTERKQAEDALRISEEKYRNLVENINDVHFTLDTQGRFTYISPVVERFAGYKVAEVIGQPFARFIHPDDLLSVQASFEQTLTGNLEPLEFRVPARNGTVLYVRSSSRPIWENGQVAGITGVATDITARKQAEEALRQARDELERRVEERTAELAKTNRMLKILSECNETLVRVTDEEDLLKQICQKIVQVGGYLLAWIGYAEQDSAKTVRPVAQAGFEDDYLNKVNITWADTERGRGPTGTAIRLGQPCIVRDIQTNPNFAPWREDAIQRGYASSIALPLWDDDRVFGALNIYAAVPDAFHDEEVRLLMELSSDLAYGILALRARAARLLAEKALHTSEARYRNLIETQTEVIARSDLNGHLTFVNDAYCHTFGKTREELLGQPFIPMVIPEDVTISMSVLEAIKSPPYRAQSETRHITPQGIRWFEWDNATILDETGNILEFQGIGRDITERKQAEEALILFRSLIDRTNDAIEVIDPETGRYLDVNEQACLAHGYTREEYLTLSVPDIDPRVAGWPREQIMEESGRTAYRVFESQHRRKDGSVFPVEVNLTYIHLDRDYQLAVVRDITDRKRAEMALRESQERYRSLYEENPSMYFTVDPAGIVLSVNRFGYEQLGYTAEELIGQSVLKVFHEEDQEAAASSVALCIQNPGQMFHWELRKVHKTGTVMWVKETARAIQEPDGRIVVFIVCEDITDRKQAEEALKQSETRFRTLVEQSPFSTQIFSPDGKTIAVNDAFCNLWSASKEVVEYLIENYNILQDEQLETAGLMPFIKQGFEHSFTKIPAILYDPQKTEIVRDLDLKAKWVLGYIWPVKDDQGTVKQVVLMHEDITERKQAEEAIRESEERYRRLVELSPDGIFVHSEGRVVYVNTAAVKLLGGKTSDDIIGKPALDFVHPSDRASVIERIRHINIEGQQAPLTEEKFMRLDGTPIDVEVAAIPFIFRGKPAVQGVMRDIAQRKRAAEALRQHVAELEAVSRLSAALRTAQTRDDALPILLDTTLAAFETDTGTIDLYDPEHDELRASVSRGWFQQLSETPMKPGEGIAGRVFATGEAHVSEEFAKDPVTRATTRPQVPPGWGGACVPIRTGTLTVGVLFISVPLPRQLAPEQVSLLESLAEMGGSALHRMSLHEETVHRLDQLQALHLIDRAITASMDLHVTLDILLEQVTTQLEVDAVDVLLFNPNTLTLEYAAGRGFRTHIAESTHLRLGENFAGRVALEHRAIQLDNLSQIRDNPQFAALWSSEGFAAYYAAPIIAKGQVKGVLQLFHRAPLAASRDWVSFLETLSGQAAIAIENAQLFDHLQRSNADLALAYDATIEGWSKALDLRDRETEGHTLRVTQMTLQLARAAGMTDEELVHVRRGALLHDIGKMGVPDAILFKPHELTEEEWIIMRKHPTYAYEMLSPITYLRPALDIPYCHHEKWDGSGYPRALKGEQIPLAARLFAVVDMYDALSSDRLYRPAWSREKTLEYIESLAGAHFDPQVARLFLKEMQEKRLGRLLE